MLGSCHLIYALKVAFVYCLYLQRLEFFSLTQHMKHPLGKFYLFSP